MEKKPCRVLITGSFDPITKGHEALVSFASSLFEEVVLGLFRNPEKTYLFTEKERLSMLRAVAKGYPNVTVVASSGMVADFVKENGIACILKGVRNEKDFAYERAMADYNLAHGGVPTLLLPASEEVAHISSSLVCAALAEGKLPRDLLPEAVIPTAMKKIGGFPK